MKSIFLKVGLILFALFTTACTSLDDKRLEEALVFAGKNRGELEKVLIYYANEPEKQEAARFLIRNMPYWFAYKGGQLDSIKPILAARDRGEYVSPEVIDKWKKVSFFSLPKVYDAHVITADYLIENIDMAFDVWKGRPWNRSLGFDDFCKFILPYRIGDEPLTSWRKLYHDYYMPILDSAYQGNDVVEACKAVDRDLKRVSYRQENIFTIPHLSADFLFRHRIGYCREASDVKLYAMRACGIPVACEYFVYSPDYQHFHSWTTLRDTTGKFIPFGFNLFEATRDSVRSDNRKKGKVYRYCFDVQKEVFPGVTVDKKVPPLFRNRFIKDVTVNYFGENEVTVPIQISDEEYIYLGIFSPNGWIPIDMARSRNGKVTFRNIEPNIIYQPLYSNGKEHFTAGYPFIYTRGKALILQPDTAQMETAVLKRKMSFIWYIRKFLYRGIIRSKIEASTDRSFSKADVLYQFNDTLTSNYYELTPPDIHKKYRYVRYVSPPDNILELAGLSIYSDSLSTKPVHMKRLNEVEPVSSLDNITDGSILSYFSSKDSACFIAYDLGKETSIGKIVFSPRNDDNFVWPGDNYELFYQDGVNGWVSLGRQTATVRELHYQVPRNALLWLRDLTKGREEQVFVYKDGRQYFTVDIKDDFSGKGE